VQDLAGAVAAVLSPPRIVSVAGDRIEEAVRADVDDPAVVVPAGTGDPQQLPYGEGAVVAFGDPQDAVLVRRPVRDVHEDRPPVRPVGMDRQTEQPLLTAGLETPHPAPQRVAAGLQAEQADLSGETLTVDDRLAVGAEVEGPRPAAAAPEDGPAGDGRRGRRRGKR
jgi:hypothetical protein